MEENGISLISFFHLIGNGTVGEDSGELPLSLQNDPFQSRDVSGEGGAFAPEFEGKIN